MKKFILICLVSVLIFSFQSTYVKIKKDRIDQVKSILYGFGVYLEKSNLPHQEVKEMEEDIRQGLKDLSDSVIIDSTKKP